MLIFAHIFLSVSAHSIVAETERTLLFCVSAAYFYLIVLEKYNISQKKLNDSIPQHKLLRIKTD